MLIIPIYAKVSDNISLHLKNIFQTGELDKNSVAEDFSVTATDGKNYNTKHYNLKAVIALKYRPIQDKLFESDFDKEMKKLLEKQK